MKMNPDMRALRTTTALLLLLAAAGAQAQQVFRIVGADGRVTYSDRPATATADRAAVPAATVVDTTTAPTINTSSLPYELRLVAQRYPVTIYTAAGCSACDSARSLLRGRGVPFLEKTIVTAADSAAFERISGNSSVPYATIGSQALQGFSSVEWTQYLDAAAYPAQSQLPATYRAPAPSPLVAATLLRPAAAAAGTVTRAAPQAPATPARNPAGIQF